MIGALAAQLQQAAHVLLGQGRGGGEPDQPRRGHLGLDLGGDGLLPPVGGRGQLALRLHGDD